MLYISQVGKRKWDTKEDRGKSIHYACIIRTVICEKAPIGLKSNSEKIKPVALAVIKLNLFAGSQ